jgi:hypothetical protein
MKIEFISKFRIIAIILIIEHLSYLLGFVAGLLCGVIGVFNMRVGACAVRVLNKDMEIVLAVHKDLVLYYTTFLKIL